MGRLFILLLALPWWAYLLLSGGAVWYGEQAHLAVVADRAARAEALAAGPPQPVDIARYDRVANGNPLGEVVLRGWIDTEFTYELVKTVNGTPSERRYLYLLFGEADPAGSDVVRGAIVLDEVERGRFETMLDGFWIDFARNGTIFEINGTVSDDAPFDKLAYEAIAERGLGPGPDFIFLTPFLEGRAKALAPVEDGDGMREMFWLIAAGLTLFGVGKRVVGVVFSGAHAEPEQGPDAVETDRGPSNTVSESGGQISASPVSGTAIVRAPPVEAGHSRGAGIPLRESSEFAYYAGLAAAMIFVGTLTYDPTLALPVLAGLAGAFGAFRLAARVLRRIERRREERTA